MNTENRPPEPSGGFQRAYNKNRFLNNNMPVEISETWGSVFSRCGLRPPKRGRAACPFHGGDSPISLSVNDDKGVFYCHVCHESGDKISFIRKLLKCSFKDALSFFGLMPGKIPKPDPEQVRRSRIRQNLQSWAAAERRRIGRIIFELNQGITIAERRIEAGNYTPDMFWGYALSKKLLLRYEPLHDLLTSRKPADWLEAHRALRKGGGYAK